MCRDGMGQHRLFRYFMYDRSIEKDPRHVSSNVTVDVDFLQKVIEVDSKGGKAHLQIYHFPTSAEDNDLRERVDHYPLIDSCDGIILMFSLVNRESYEEMQQLYRFLLLRQNNHIHQELKKSGNSGDVLGSPSRSRGSSVAKGSSASNHAYQGSVSAFLEGVPLDKPLVVVGLDAERCEPPKFVSSQLAARYSFFAQLLRLLERPTSADIATRIVEFLHGADFDIVLQLDPQLEAARLTYAGSERCVWFEEAAGVVRDWAGPNEKRVLVHSHSNPPSLRGKPSIADLNTHGSSALNIETLEQVVNADPNSGKLAASQSGTKRSPSKNAPTLQGSTSGCRFGHFSYVEVSSVEGYNYARGFNEMTGIIIQKSFEAKPKKHQSGKSCFVQ